MKPISIRRIVEAVSGKLAWGDDNAFVTSVIIDSRKACSGALFVPIIGERVDAHRFIPDVLEAGAAVTFSSDPDVKYEKGACIVVEDTLAALQKFAAWYRSQFDIPVIGVTGSVGKTTTKEMIAAVLEKKYRTVKTIGNFNSQIGVSLMMFHLDDLTQMAVIEMGISMPGEMDHLVDIARPTAAVLTNVGVSHIGNLGSRGNICHEKGKIIKNLPENGTFYVCGNGDLKELSQEHVPYDLCPHPCEVIYYGTEDGCTRYGDSIESTSEGQTFIYHSEEKEVPVSLSVMGSHNVNNAVIAMALAERFGVSESDAKEALSEYHPIAMRGVVKDASGAHVIDDTYNASPDSINSNLRALFEHDGGRKIAVLADVLELGEQSAKLHEEIGQFITDEADRGRKLDLLVTVGEESRNIHRYVMKNSNIKCVHCADNTEAADAVREYMGTGDWILVKGSRGMHMDEVVESLTKE